MHTLNLPLIAATALLVALPAFAQDAAPDEALPPTTEEVLPPGGEAPVDQVPPISDVAPDGGEPDAMVSHLSCSFTQQCEDGTCAESGYAGSLIVMSDGAGMAEAEWDDDTGPLAFTALLDGYLIRAYSSDNNSENPSPVQQMLTIGADGAARLSVHHTDPVHALSYSGTCVAAG